MLLVARSLKPRQEGSKTDFQSRIQFVAINWNNNLDILFFPEAIGKASNCILFSQKV